ncbi:hypothetical protein [Pilimelia terevasa]|nr:hypothetical protein [Pilimelia terevasa]
MSAELSGAITVVGDAAPDRFDVLAYPVDSDNAVARGQVTGDGRFTVAGVAPGRYRLQADTWRGRGFGTLWWPGTHDPAQATVFTVADDGPVAVPTMTVPVGAVEGRITSQGGEPVKRAPVFLDATYGRPGSGPADLERASTGSDGRYRFATVIGGGYKVGTGMRFSDDEDTVVTQWLPGRWVRARADTVAVEAGQTTVVDQRQLPLPRAAVVSGRLTVTGGASATEFAVWPVDHYAWRGPVAADGSFELSPLPPGEYQFSVSSGNAAAWLPGGGLHRPTEWLTIDAGEHRVLDPLHLSVGRISGRLTTRTAGVPPYGAHALLHRVAPDGSTDPAVPLTRQARVADDDGNFDFAAVAPGRYKISVRLRGGPTAKPHQWVPGRRTPTDARVFTVGIGDHLIVPDEVVLPRKP